jgi:hypothetical protein
METTEELVMCYFQTWQNQEWERMRDCLSVNFKADGGQIQFHHRDQFIEFCKHGPSWKQVTLLDSLFQKTKAALLYEGTTAKGERIRVAEFLEINQGSILSSKMAISLG